MIIRLYSVDVSYPPGLEDMINAFKLCATVRLFLQVIFAFLDVDKKILQFLTTVLLLFQDIQSFLFELSRVNIDHVWVI